MLSRKIFLFIMKQVFDTVEYDGRKLNNYTGNHGVVGINILHRDETKDKCRATHKQF
jgi:hypothetical protein